MGIDRIRWGYKPHLAYGGDRRYEELIGTLTERRDAAAAAAAAAEAASGAGEASRLTKQCGLEGLFTPLRPKPPRWPVESSC